MLRTHAAEIALMRERGGLQLRGDRKTDLGRDLARLGERARKTAFGGREAASREIGLGHMLGEHAAARQRRH